MIQILIWAADRMLKDGHNALLPFRLIVAARWKKWPGHLALVAGLCFGPRSGAVNYEVYPGSAFYLTQMVDRTSYPYVAEFANGFYFHPVGFRRLPGMTLTPQEKQRICDNFSNHFAMVEGDMGYTNSGAALKDIKAIIELGMTPAAAFVNRAASTEVWRRLIARNGELGTASYEMVAPHVISRYTGGFYNTNFDHVRSNMLVPGCLGSGVDAPIYLYRHFAVKKNSPMAAEEARTGESFYQRSIWDLRDWTVAHGKKFNYLISPNESVGPQFLADTKYLVWSLENGGHEADVYSVALYGRRPFNLVPETTNYNGMVQANGTVTGVAYYLLMHRDGEPGTLDLHATSGLDIYAKEATSPVLERPEQVVPFNPTAKNEFTLTLTNRSKWLDYAAVLRARTAQAEKWNILFEFGGRDVTRSVMSETGMVFLADRRLLPQTSQSLTIKLSPKGAPTPLNLVIEALPHAGVEQALDVIAFQYQTNQSPPTLAFPTVDRHTRPGLATGPIWFTVGDAETVSSKLAVAGVSANPALVSDTNIKFGQSGVQRWVNFAPTPGHTGVAPITLTVSDGRFRVSKTFNLLVEDDGKADKFSPNQSRAGR